MPPIEMASPDFIRWQTEIERYLALQGWSPVEGERGGTDEAP
jgi:hypothetical protein